MNNYDNKNTMIYNMMYTSYEEVGQEMTTQDFLQLEALMDKLADIYSEQDMTKLVCLEKEFYKLVAIYYS